MASGGAVWVTFSPNRLDADAPANVIRTIDDATPGAGQIVMVTLNPRDVSGFYAVHEELCTLSVQDNTADGFTFLAGDANDNEVVGVVDFSRLVASFFLYRGDSGFDASSDFARDGCVRFMYFTLLADHFAKPLC